MDDEYKATMRRIRAAIDLSEEDAQAAESSKLRLYFEGKANGLRWALDVVRHEMGDGQ